ncbi:MAG: hypothetical protein CSA76_07210 [Spirochaetales bacterium]|nr:MAG: hypothetical protein CSA76_07210 [Spirochaetales bacterium]
MGSMKRNTHRSKDASREELLRELEEFEAEREKLRDILGRIGGQSFSKKDTWINITFLVLILGLFLLEVITHAIPANLSLELGVLLVSVKIVFMIHTQQKVNHFQFWILNSMEFRMNDIAKRIRSLEKKLKEQTED